MKRTKKDLANHIFDAIEKLSNKEITTEEARCHSKLASQAIALFKIQLEETKLKMDLENHHKNSGSKIEIESYEN